MDYFNDIRQAVLDKIVAEESTIQEAHFEEVARFDGSPAAVIGVSSNEALYNSNTTDRITFVFQVRIYIPLPEGNATEEVERNMGKAYWDVLSMFNSRKALGASADIVEPIPSIWGYEERGEGIYRFAEVIVRCVKFVSNQ